MLVNQITRYRAVTGSAGRSWKVAPDPATDATTVASPMSLGNSSATRSSTSGPARLESISTASTRVGAPRSTTTPTPSLRLPKAASL